MSKLILAVTDKYSANDTVIHDSQKAEQTIKSIKKIAEAALTHVVIMIRKLIYLNNVVPSQ